MEEEVGESGGRLGLPEDNTEVDSNFGSGKIELPAPEDGSISQDPLEIKEADVRSGTPMLTPEKLVNSQEMDNEAKYSEDKVCLDDHESSSSPILTQVSMDCRSFMESDDYSAADIVSEMSTSMKNHSNVDDEGATPQFEDKKEILRKESEDVVMEIAERLSQLRSIGKTAESARKYILESDVDASTEDLDSNDHMSELLGPKRLDFEVIDFDQFGAQPPDLPLNDNSTKNHHHGGIISSFQSGKVKAKKSESHASARHGFDQEMKGLHDSPVKNTPEKKHLRREREGGRGQDVSDTHSISGRTGSSKPRLLDSGKPKKLSEAASGSPIRRSKSTLPDLKGSPVHEETRRRTEAQKRLEEYCNRVDLSTAQLEQQSRMQGEVSRKLERERSERLKSDAKLMMLCELLPSVEEKLKSLCDQMLVVEAQLQEQMGLRKKLEEALERERHGVKLEDQVDLRSILDQEREERMHLAVKLEEQVDKLLEQERQVRMHLAAELEDQVDLRNNILEQERQERMHLAAKQEEQVKKLEGSLEQVLQERAQFVAKLDEQVDLRNKLEKSLECSLQERMQFVAKLEEQGKDLEQERQERIAQLGDLRNGLELEQYEEQIRELACKLEQERDERLAGLVAVKLEDQVDLRSILEQEREERMHLAVKLEEQVDKLLEQERQERMHLAAKQEDQVDKLEGSLKQVLQDLEQERQERVAQLGDLRNRLDRVQYEEQIRELACKLEQERDERLAGLVVLREMEEKLVDLNNQVESLTSQLKEETQLREELQIKSDQGLEELGNKFEEGVRNGINLKDLHDQVLVLAAQLQEQIELRKDLEERLERMPNAVVMANHTPESLSIEEKSVFAKMLDEQNQLLANQVKEAEMLKSATEKVGLLNHQVQNLEMLSEIVETMENVRSLKERATRQTMWTIFQAVCLVMGLVSFIVSCRNPLLSSLHPT